MTSDIKDMVNEDSSEESLGKRRCAEVISENNDLLMEEKVIFNYDKRVKCKTLPNF